ncbi:MAG TPA: hypothetical protein VEK07_03130 [Polyangiaceae bacterium]|nr:hypothetical protein [Polyangiaceae bacterium]
MIQPPLPRGLRRLVPTVSLALSSAVAWAAPPAAPNFSGGSTAPPPSPDGAAPASLGDVTPKGPAVPTGPGASPAPSPSDASAAAPTGEATATFPVWQVPTFSSDAIGALSNAIDLTLKMYGDTGLAVRNNDYQPWPTGTSNPNVYAPGVWNSFFAPRLDLFGAADVAKLTFLTEVMFEAENNEIGIDVERLQISYLFTNWLRVRAGRTHVAWGYYNDTYHHGNLFELTTSRPYSVNFEDSLGIILTHNVGVGIDGTFDVGSTGSIRYDAEVGNGRAADITAVDMQFAQKNQKDVNVRLRWIFSNGLIIGVNGLRDVVPALGGPPGVLTRPVTEELIGGGHIVYMENHAHVDIEAFAMRHNPTGAPSTNIFGGFAELGYAVGPLTPYVRAECMRFPASGDIIYQYAADSPQGILVGNASVYAGVRDFSDLRVGLKWLAMPQLALKLEGERLGRGTGGPVLATASQSQEIATAKAAFGFW